ncbi:hypothetical protein AC249_AIPGENE16314 [Exaiptasia diaphana]|nr:hypothetical protein AC249_AIPGENE16314 [Exaiptasia diaphana]
MAAASACRFCTKTCAPARRSVLYSAYGDYTEVARLFYEVYGQSVKKDPSLSRYCCRNCKLKAERIKKNKKPTRAESSLNKTPQTPERPVRVNSPARKAPRIFSPIRPIPKRTSSPIRKTLTAISRKDLEGNKSDAVNQTRDKTPKSRLGLQFGQSSAQNVPIIDNGCPISFPQISYQIICYSPLGITPVSVLPKWNNLCQAIIENNEVNSDKQNVDPPQLAQLKTLALRCERIFE